MRVLIISDAWHPQVNGVVRTYEYLTKELEANGYTVEVIGPASFAACVPMPFYPEIKLVIRPYHRLSQMIEDFKPDRLHIATEGPLGWAARRYCLRKNVPFSSSYHTQFPDYVAKRFAWLIPPLYNAVHKQAIKIVRAFHAPSSALMIATQSLEDQLRDWGFKTPIKRLLRGVDFTVFSTKDAEALSLDLKKDIKGPIALYVGRLAIEKNLKAFLDMAWTGTKIMVGDGPIRAELEDKYPDAIFTGKKIGVELTAYYSASDVFVFPSKTDTFGIVLIEALACGLPVAAYPVIGPKDIITDERLGCLNETDLSAAAYKAMETVDPEFCSNHVKENYSWNVAGRQFIDAL